MLISLAQELHASFLELFGLPITEVAEIVKDFNEVTAERVRAQKAQLRAKS